MAAGKVRHRAKQQLSTAAAAVVVVVLLLLLLHAPSLIWQVHRGKKLVKGVRRASNKGAVGAAFRYHDTTIAFVTCHLAADKKGRSNLGGRLKDTRMVLEGMELEYDALGFDLQVEARDPHAGMYAYDALGFDLQVTRMQACMRLRSRALTTRSALSLPAALLPPRRPPRRPRTGPPP